MTVVEFVAKDWIDRLALALQPLAAAQEPYLREYWEQNPRVHVLSVGQEGHRSAFPPDDLRDLYAMACHGHLFGKDEHYGRRCRSRLAVTAFSVQMGTTADRISAVVSLSTRLA